MIAMWVRHLLQRSGFRVLAEPAGKHSEQHLRPFRGILQADAFTGYDRLFQCKNVKVVHRQKLRAGPMPGENPRCIHQQQKCDGRRSTEANQRNCTPSRMKYGDYRSQRSLLVSSSEVPLTSLHEWMVEKNGTLSKKIQTGRSVQLQN